MDSSAPAMLVPRRSSVWRASTSRDAGNTNDTATPTAAPITVSRARHQPVVAGVTLSAASTTRALIGT